MSMRGLELDNFLMIPAKKSRLVELCRAYELRGLESMTSFMAIVCTLRTDGGEMST